jgi:hypothetical protein
MSSEKDCILDAFWLIFKLSNKARATQYLNEHLGLSVPTFVKFHVNKKNDGYICVAIDMVKPYHIQGLMQGWPAGRNNPEVCPIWHRIYKETETALAELHIFITTHTVKFVPVASDFFGEKVDSGYIILDYTGFDQEISSHIEHNEQ